MKNAFSALIALPFLWATVALTGCTTPEEENTQYVRVSDAACTFKGTSNLPVTIEVYSNPSAWKAEPSASWVKITDKADNSFTIQVDDNESVDTRTAQITVTAGKAETIIDVMQVGIDAMLYRYRWNPEIFQNMAPMSPNGKYVGSFYFLKDDTGTTQFYPVIIDVETDEWHELGPYPKSFGEFGQTSCITDNGEVIIAVLNDANVIFDLEGNYRKIEAPAGYASYPEISQVASDGTMVGWCSKGGISDPFKWVNGVAEPLTKPELNYRDEPIGDVQARGISADGRIVYGTTWDNMDYGLIYWDENGDVHYVGEDKRYCRAVDRPDGYGGTYKYNLCDGMWTTATNTNVSPNGKYIAGTFRREKLVDGENGSEVAETNYPAFFNTETKQTVIFEELVGGGGVTATSDGLGFTCNDTFGASTGKVVDIENGIVLGDVTDWIWDNYGIIVPSGYITYMPDSKDRFLGGALWTGGAVVQGVNWYVAPPAK